MIFPTLSVTEFTIKFVLTNWEEITVRQLQELTLASLAEYSWVIAMCQLLHMSLLNSLVITFC